MEDGYCSKERLKELNTKEKQLKEFIMQLIIATRANKSEVIRVCAVLIHNFKSKRVS